MTTPAELVREACGLLAGYLPELAALTPEPDESAFAAPGMTARPPAAPLPGNAQALFALTAIHATARQLEGILLYAAGRRRGGPLAVRGDSDANTLAAFDAICRLIDAADDDLYRIVTGELERRLNEARSLPAIDEAQQWRHLRGRPCPYCGCYFLKTLLDASKRSTGHVECFTVRCADEDGLRPVATMGTDDQGRAVLRWRAGLTELGLDAA